MTGYVGKQSQPYAIILIYRLPVAQRCKLRGNCNLVIKSVTSVQDHNLN